MPDPKKQNLIISAPEDPKAILLPTTTWTCTLVAQHTCEWFLPSC